jgi:hypothetical protein
MVWGGFGSELQIYTGRIGPFGAVAVKVLVMGTTLYWQDRPIWCSVAVKVLVMGTTLYWQDRPIWCSVAVKVLVAGTTLPHHHFCYKIYIPPEVLTS